MLEVKLYRELAWWLSLNQPQFPEANAGVLTAVAVIKVHFVLTIGSLGVALLLNLFGIQHVGVLNDNDN